jgi:peptidoglycan/xylan/chitin deacetylase (PgdA/CDA1 family)/FlaG/FlaF family flagellin (archaellin)
MVKIRFQRAMHAISPVVAVLLMIVIVVASSLVAYAWTMGYIDTTTSKLDSALQIQSYFAEDGNLKIYVQNVGKSVLRFNPDSSVYVDNTIVSLLKVNENAPPPTITLSPGETGSLIVGFDVASNSVVNIKIVTSTGISTQTEGPLVFHGSVPGPEPIIHGVISISFDDGYRSQFDNAYPLLVSKGVKATFYIITDCIRDVEPNNENYMSVSELKTLYDHGNEVASHSVQHLWLPSLSDEQLNEECRVSQQILRSYGLGEISDFAYPGGGGWNDPRVNSIISQYYGSARSITGSPMPIPTSPFVLSAVWGDSNDMLQATVNQVASTNSWIVVLFHSVVQQYGNPPDPYSVSVSDLSSFIDYATSQGVKILPVNEALAAVAP